MQHPGVRPLSPVADLSPWHLPGVGDPEINQDPLCPKGGKRDRPTDLAGVGWDQMQYEMFDPVLGNLTGTVKRWGIALHNNSGCLIVKFSKLFFLV